MSEPTIRDNNGRREVLDPVRKRYVALTPEEWVRQQMIIFLHEQRNYPLELMQVEGAISLNGLVKRCDIVLYNREARPLMIVECKQPEVPINQKVLDQASRYNLTLQVPYLCLTNGRQLVVLKVDFASQKLISLPEVPDWKTL